MKRLTCISIATALIGLIATSARAQAQAAAPNAALRYWMAFALMRDPPADQATADLLESVATGKTPWDEARLGRILDANSEALEVMQRGTSLTFCDWGIEYDRGSSAPIAHVAKARVLGRLNALAGMRLAAQGQAAQAAETWLEGLRFSQHIAQGGTLISVLVASATLRPALHALAGLVPSLGAPQRTQIERVIQALPDTALDWAEAMRREEGVMDVTVQQLSRASDPKIYYRAITGQPAPDRFTVPSAADVKHFHDIVAQMVEALRLPPDQTRIRLDEIEAGRKTLHPFYQDRLPRLTGMNETRAGIRADRQQLLAAVSRSRP